MEYGDTTRLVLWSVRTCMYCERSSFWSAIDCLWKPPTPVNTSTLDRTGIYFETTCNRNLQISLVPRHSFTLLPWPHVLLLNTSSPRTLVAAIANLDSSGSQLASTLIPLASSALRSLPLPRTTYPHRDAERASQYKARWPSYCSWPISSSLLSAPPPSLLRADPASSASRPRVTNITTPTVSPSTPKPSQSGEAMFPRDSPAMFRTRDKVRLPDCYTSTLHR